MTFKIILVENLELEKNEFKIENGWKLRSALACILSEISIPII